MSTRRETPRHARPLAGLLTAAAVVAIVAGAASLFRGSFTPTVPVTVLSQRAGLVMNPDAKVKLYGVQVGKVASIESRPDGQAALHLDINPAQMHLIPSNVLVDIASTTVFGAKSVELETPPDPSSKPLQSGQILTAQQVTVETNTVFQQLTSVLGSIEPAKLNETLGAFARAFDGRGKQFGQALSDFNAMLAKIEPSIPALRRDIAMAPAVVDAYADAAPDLMATADNATRISRTLIDERDSLDRLLISVIGLADIGNDVIGGNRQALTTVLDLLVPTTNLTSEYNQNLNCGIAGIVPFTKGAPLPEPGALISLGFIAGVERYRYPANLPKVAAKGPSSCGPMGLPDVGSENPPPFLVTDTGANPFQYGNQGLLLNSDGLKQLLFGPIDGPPRNTAQIGEPG